MIKKKINQTFVWFISRHKIKLPGLNKFIWKKDKTFKLRIYGRPTLSKQNRSPLR